MSGSRPPVGRRRSLARHSLAAALGAALIASLVPGVTVSAEEPRPGRLTKAERRQLHEARMAGRSSIRVLVATEPGAGGRVESAIRRLGGTVEYREDTVRYIRAALPMARVEEARSIEGVVSTELEQVLPLADPRPGAGDDRFVTPQAPPGRGTARVNPYLPTGDTGAAQFAAAHPMWDGRGVKIGILDTGTDLGHPSLRTTSTGAPKTVDWVTYTDPRDTSALRDPTWVRIGTTVTGPSFAVDGISYTAPAGTYRFGRFDERDPLLGGEVGNDVNRDGNPAGSSGVFGVLYDASTNRVRVDTDQDRDFGDETAITDYRTAFEVGELGRDDPATPIRESMPFVVQTDRARDNPQIPGAGGWVNIGIPSGAHGSHVAGIAAGHALFGGAMSGAAPGAQIVSVRVCQFVGGCSSFGLIEGMIFAARDAGVDVINVSIGGLPAVNDGNNTRAVLYNNVVDAYGVQLFASAGNGGPGINTVGDPAVAGKVLAVGAFVSDATWRSNYGSDSAWGDNVHPLGSVGPGEDGGFKPDFVAPAAAVSTTPTWQPGQPTPGVYALPPGYGMFNGTSMAAPQATGAAALLVGAARLAGLEWTPASLRLAMGSSARFLDRYGALEQGHGLLDVQRAWNLLARGPRAEAIVSRVPVHTSLAASLAEPGLGPGIHDREGVTLGESYTRRYTFTRTTGPSAATAYTLRWVGNDGTFGAVPASILLPRDVPTAVDVTVNPTEYGVHSAILEVDDPRSPGIDYATMNVVVVPHDFTAAGGFTVSQSGTVGRNQALRSYLRVPEGAAALVLEFDGPAPEGGSGQARFLRYQPSGIAAEPSTSGVACYTPAVSDAPECNASSRTHARPPAGVWEVTVDARRTSEVDPVPFALTASVLGATVTPDRDPVAAATVGTPIDRRYTLRNNLGTFVGRAAGTPLGSARRSRESIAEREVQQFFVTVTEGSLSLRATIGNAEDPQADLDLFVDFCPTLTTCEQRGRDADADADESVTISDPTPGLWRIRVDAFDVPAGTTAYDYLDVFVNPAFGSIGVSDADELRPAGTTWTAAATVTATRPPGRGRDLLGKVEVRTAEPGNVLIGSGEVIVESVVPARP